MTQLERSNLSENQITILPTQIGLLTSLQILHLRNNKLSFIPSDLVNKQHKSSFFFINVLFSEMLCFMIKLDTNEGH
jgi:Leucine-rich repeat (LRR) protein